VLVQEILKGLGGPVSLELDGLILGSGNKNVVSKRGHAARERPNSTTTTTTSS